MVITASVLLIKIGSMFRISVNELIVLVLILSILTVLSLIDILKNEFHGNNKIIWILIVIVFPVLGSILYYFIGRKQRINPTSQNQIHQK